MQNTTETDDIDSLEGLFSNEALYGCASGLRGRPLTGDGPSERPRKAPRKSRSKVANRVISREEIARSRSAFKA